MGRRGPAPKPTKLRILQGNPGKRKVRKDEPAPPPVADGDAPDFLEGLALDEWNRVAPELRKLGLLTVVDVPMLAIYCSTFASWRAAELKVRELTKDPKEGYAAALMQGWVKRAKEERAALRQLAAEFGFTPASRSRVPAAGGGEKDENPLDEFLNAGAKGGAA